jgi:hypothetical protein
MYLRYSTNVLDPDPVRYRLFGQIESVSGLIPDLDNTGSGSEYDLTRKFVLFLQVYLENCPLRLFFHKHFLKNLENALKPCSSPISSTYNLSII